MMTEMGNLLGKITDPMTIIIKVVIVMSELLCFFKVSI